MRIEAGVAASCNITFAEPKGLLMYKTIYADEIPWEICRPYSDSEMLDYLNSCISSDDSRIFTIKVSTKAEANRCHAAYISHLNLGANPDVLFGIRA